MKKIVWLSILVFIISIAAFGCDSGKDKTQPRGKYIYDEAGRLPVQSEIALASYLWRLDSQTGYELVMIFPKGQMDENGIISWFNEHGVGKDEVDNGAAVFVMPDNSIFVAIGSGNDKVSVTASKTFGERIFKDFEKDPVLTLLRFSSAVVGKINEGVGREVGKRVFDDIKNNFDVILLWAAAVALFFFLIQQFNGFQAHDLILPIAVFVALGMFFGIGALSSNVSKATYNSYGVITSTKLDSYVWIETRVISTGKTTTVVTIPHTRYTNNAEIMSYATKSYRYKFWSDDSRWAWDRQIGEVNSLNLNIDDDSLHGAYVVNDHSGGKMIGDGVWILAAKNAAKTKK